MRLRPFIPYYDFDEIKNWISDERTHAMWCANLIKYPIEKENFENVLLDLWSEKQMLMHFLFKMNYGVDAIW